MVAMPTYGRSFTLASSLDTTVRAQATGHGIPDPFTKDGGEPKTASLLWSKKTQNHPEYCAEQGLLLP